MYALSLELLLMTTNFFYQKLYKVAFQIGDVQLKLQQSILKQIQLIQITIN